MLRPSLRTRSRRPRRPCMPRAHLRAGRFSNTSVLPAPRAYSIKNKTVVLKVLGAILLARAEFGRLDGVLLLLTWLEVRARPAPRTVRRYLLPLRRRLWREPNCSWISLQRQTSSTNGGPPSTSSSVSPTATLRGHRARRSCDTTARCKPMSTRPVEPPPWCMLPPEGQDRRPAGPITTPTPPPRRTRGLDATSAKFFMNGNKRTLEPASSVEERRGVSQTCAVTS